MAGYDIMDIILCGETERDRALDANKKKDVHYIQKGVKRTNNSVNICCFSKESTT